MANTGSALFKELNSDEIAEIIHKALNDSPKSWELANGGLFNTTYLVMLNSGRKVILRVGPVNTQTLMCFEHNMMEAESYVYTLMEANGIPCSKVLSLGKTGDRDYMIVDFIESMALSGASISDEDRRCIGVTFGQYIKRMHEIKPEGIGRATEVVSGNSSPDWYTHIYNEVYKITEKGLENGAFSEAEKQLIDSSVEHCRNILLEVTDIRLCHGDLWDGNILVGDREGKTELLAIIDTDRAVFGDIDFDLGNPWILSDAFLEGYGISRQELESGHRCIRRKIYTMMYFIYETYVWYCEHNIPQNAEGARKTVLSIAKELLESE